MLMMCLSEGAGKFLFYVVVSLKREETQLFIERSIVSLTQNNHLARRSKALGIKP